MRIMNYAYDLEKAEPLLYHISKKHRRMVIENLFAFRREFVPKIQYFEINFSSFLAYSLVMHIEERPQVRHLLSVSFFTWKQLEKIIDLKKKMKDNIVIKDLRLLSPEEKWPMHLVADLCTATDGFTLNALPLYPDSETHLYILPAIPYHLTCKLDLTQSNHDPLVFSERTKESKIAKLELRVGSLRELRRVL